MRALATRRGFTLVEVVVATAVLSLLLLATVTALRTLGNTQLAIERTTARVDQIRSVSVFLRDLMERAVVGAETGGLTLGGGGRDATYFRLNEGIEWKSTILFGEAFGGTHIVRVSAEGDALVLRWSEPSEAGEGPETWDDAPSRTLVTDLEEFQFWVRKDHDTDWVDDWPEQRQAPALVRLQIKAAGRYWPELVMQVQQ